MKRLQKTFGVLLAILLVASSFSLNTSTTVLADSPEELDTSKDTYIYKAAPNSVYGASESITIYDRSNHTSRVVIEWDLSSLPEGVLITDASLELYYYEYSGTNPTGKAVNLHILSREDWVEGEATWNIYKTGSNWTSAGGDYDGGVEATTNAPAAAGAWMEWDVTDLVTDCYDADAPVEMLLKFGTEEKASGYSLLRWRSSDYSGGDEFKPKLTVTYDAPGADPVVVTLAVLESGTESGELRGNIFSLGGEAAVEVSFEYGEDVGLGDETTPVELTETGIFTEELTGLTPGKTYYYRAKVYWDVAEEYTGETLTFQTGVTEQEGGPSTVSTSAAEGQGAISYPYQRKTFYAAGLHWLFYSDGANGVYRTSGDGDTWSSPLTFRSSITNGTYFSVYFDGTYLSYSYGKTTSGGSLYYRRGTPESNGSITWSASEQVVKAGVAGVYLDFPSITVDTNGYTWIGYRYQSPVGIAVPYVTRSGNTNGTWGTTPAGFPYALATSNAGGSHPQSMVGSVIPLTDGKVIAVGASQMTDRRIRVHVWDGSAWRAVLTTTETPSQARTFSMVAVGDDAHLVFTDTATGEIQYVYYDYSAHTLSAELAIATTTTNVIAPVISQDVNDNLYVFWVGSPDANYIYYRRSDGTDWTETIAWLEEPGSFQVVGGTFQRLTSSGQDFGGYIGLAYEIDSGSTVTIRYAWARPEALAEPPEVDSLTPTNILTTSADLRGDITSLGSYEEVTASFQYGLTTALGSSSTTTDRSSTGIYSVALAGLTEDTLYYVRAKLVYAGTEEVYGSTISFRTASEGEAAVTTGSAASVGSTSATLQGTLDSLGDYSLVYVSFEYGKTTSYGSLTPEVGLDVVDAFQENITGLESSTTYFFRAKARGSGGNTTYGGSQSFTTSSTPLGAPTNLKVSNITSSSLSLSWAKGSGSILTMIRFSTSGYPSSTSSGTQLYLDSGSSYTHTGLEEGLTYYYSAWAVAGVNYSTTYASTSGTPSLAGLPLPDNMLIESVEVFNDFLEAGDQLYVVAYKLIYEEEPVSSASEFFTLSINEEDSLLALGIVSSWGYRPGSIYLSPSGALVSNKAYEVKLEGLASKWGTTLETSYDLATSSWKGNTLELLDGWVRGLATRMQAYYGVELTTYRPGYGIVLNSTGSEIFRSAIPGLQVVRPGLFSSGISQITITSEPGSRGYEEAVAEHLGDAALAKFTNLGEHLGLSGTATAGLLLGLLLLLVVGGITSITGSSLVGVIVSLPLLLAGGFLGIIPLALIAVFGALLVLFLLSSIILARS